MTSRHVVLACLERNPPALFEAALWIAVEHDPEVQPPTLLRDMSMLQQQIGSALPTLPALELAQPLLRSLISLGFREDDSMPLSPQAALLDKVLLRKRGQPLALGLIALELARRLRIPMVGVDFPGYFLLRVRGADHLLDPCTGRSLYLNDCRELLVRLFGAHPTLQAEHMRQANPIDILQRLSRNLCHLHQACNDPLAALKDADRILQLTPPNTSDYLTRANLYQHLACPSAERFDVERALLLCEDPIQILRLTARLDLLPRTGVMH